MARTIQRVKWVAVTLVTVGSLAVGATQAFATTRTMRACPEPSIGACTSTLQCQDACDVAFPGTTGVCQENNHCCYCLE